MNTSLYKAYIYIFWRLTRWLQSDFDFSEKWGEWKASVAIGVLEVYVLLGAAFLLEYFVFGRGELFPENPIPLFMLVAGILVVLNHRMLNKKKAMEFKREFESYPRRKHIFYGFAVVGLILGVLFGMFAILYLGRSN